MGFRMSPRKPYPSDLSDAEWQAIEPHLGPAKFGGRPRTVDLREILNAIFYVARTGCQWSALPNDLPPKSTAYDYYARWTEDGTFQHIHDTLRDLVRQKAGREKEPSRAIIDSQSVKTTEVGGEKQGLRRRKKAQGP